MNGACYSTKKGIGMSHRFDCDCTLCHYGEDEPIDRWPTPAKRCRECNAPLDYVGMCRDCDIRAKAELSAELELERWKDEGS